MNTRQLQYAVMLSRVKNFSHTAEQLGISQPALSKQILALEHELELKLFERTTNHVSLTPAGEYFAKEAEKLLFHESQLIKAMERYKTGENGQLVIGISPFRSLYLMPELIKTIQDEFPGIKVVLVELAKNLLHKGICEGKYDFAIMNLPVDETQLEVIPLEQDVLMMAIPNSMLDLVDDYNNQGSIDLLSCKKLPFVVLSPGQEMRQLFDKLCAVDNITPHIQLEVVGITTAWAMVQAGIGATLLPKQFAVNMNTENISLLELKSKAYIRQPAVITKRGQHVSPYAAFAIEKLSCLR